MVYCHANGADIAEAVDSVAAHMAQGYRAIRAQSGVPGLDKVYGVPKGAARPMNRPRRGCRPKRSGRRKNI